jgi:hypothetical protein
VARRHPAAVRRATKPDDDDEVEDADETAAKA